MSIKVISIVSYNFLPARFGGQKAIALFYKYFSKHVDLTCVTTQNNDTTEVHGYKILNILSNSFLKYINVFYFFTLKKIIKQNNSKYLLLEHPYYGWLGLLLKLFCGVKLIIHSHNIESLRWKSLKKWWWKILWFYEKIVHRNADYNFFITDEDRLFAEQHYKLHSSKCITTTYGIEWNKAPEFAKRKESKTLIQQQHDIAADKKILLFNGTFDYKPNRDALYNIVEKINPILLKQKKFSYAILICGKNIPEDLLQRKFDNVIFIGFVEDINIYFLGSDIFLNPVIEGGGIKTKLVEALGNSMNAVSTENGAIGVNESICNGKLTIIKTNDWTVFANAVVNTTTVNEMNNSFFEKFYWENIGKKASDFIQFS